jgi:hypothetical protein
MLVYVANLDQGEFTEGHALDRKTERQVPKEMIGRRMSQEEAKRLLQLTAGTTALDRTIVCKSIAE